MAHASTRTIVQRLLQLASDPDNQTFIVQEQGCLAGLTSYLDDSDTEVVRMAIEAISLLSSRRSNRKNLVGHPGLAEKVKKLTTHHNSLIQNFAVTSAKSLKLHKGAKTTRNYDGNGENSNTINNNTLGADSNGTKEKKKSKKRKLKTYKLKVKDLDDDEICSRIEQGIIRVRGVVSLTLDQNKRRVIITSKVSKSEIIPIVTEVIESCGTVVILKKKKKSGEPSGYCDDEETEDIFGEGVLSRFGSQTLQSRLAAQRKKEEKRKLEESNMSRIAQAAGGAARWGLSFLGY